MKKVLNLMLLCATMALCLSSCSNEEKESAKLNRNELTLTVGQSAKLLYDGDCTWKSDEPLIAEVDNDGNVTANLVGETNIYANDEICRVTVEPLYDTYMEPCLKWGASESDVMSFMDGYRYMGKDGEFLTFADLINEVMYMYRFDGGLVASFMAADILTNGEEIANFILERYVVVDVDEYDYTVYLTDIDVTVMVGIYLDAETGIITVVYTPFTTEAKAYRPEIGYNEILGKYAPANKVGENKIKELIGKFKK
jgi:hypothetical protein